MSCSLPARRARLLALTALTGTTAVAGALATAAPALAAPVAIAGYTTEVPEGTPATGAEHYFNAVTLTNGDTAYGVDEDQPMAPVGEPVLDDESYAVAEPFDDPESGWLDVVGEKAGDHPVYWEQGNAALAGYILSVFGATEDADEALAVHWAVRSLATAPGPLPELSGLGESHLDRAEFMVQDARNNVGSLVPQDSYATDITVSDTGRPTQLSIELPEAHHATTVTLTGPVAFADGTTTMTFTGEPRERVLDLVVDEGVTEGEFTATLTATMPSTELTALADDQYRDLLIAGQDRMVTWSAGATFEIAEPAEPGTGAPDEEAESPEDGGTSTPADDSADQGTQGAGTDAGPRAGENPAEGEIVRDLVTKQDGAAAQRTTATLEAFVLFEEQTTTHTEVVTETTVTAGGAAYADPVMADTGMGAAQTTSGRSGAAPVVLAVIAVAAGLGAWVLRRRKPSGPERDTAVS